MAKEKDSSAKSKSSKSKIASASTEKALQEAGSKGTKPSKASAMKAELEGVSSEKGSTTDGGATQSSPESGDYENTKQDVSSSSNNEPSVPLGSILGLRKVDPAKHKKWVRGFVMIVLASVTMMLWKYLWWVFLLGFVFQLAMLLLVEGGERRFYDFFKVVSDFFANIIGYCWGVVSSLPKPLHGVEDWLKEVLFQTSAKK